MLKLNIIILLFIGLTSSLYCQKYHGYDLDPFAPFYFDNLGFKVDYNHFKQFNQIIISYLDQYLQFPDIPYDCIAHNISLGLRTSNNSKPELIYKYTFVDYSIYGPPTPSGDVPLPLHPGSRDYGFWNNYARIIIFNLDKTGYEKLLINWLNIRYGYGITTYDQPDKYDQFNLDAVLYGKLGINSINLGNINFGEIGNDKKFHFGVEPGLGLNLNFYYKNDFYIKPFIEISSAISDFTIRKLSMGLNGDYIIKGDNQGKNNFDISLGLNYDKYFIRDHSFEFVKFSLGVKFFKYTFY